MPSENKKVKNATAFIDNGIAFKSVMEARIYKKLIEKGITPEYEPDKIILLKGFKPKHKWFIDGKSQIAKIRDLTYTPDFKFQYCGYIVYIEVKGFITDRYPLKRKMFLSYLDSEDGKTIFAEIKTISGLNRTLEQISSLIKQPDSEESNYKIL